MGMVDQVYRERPVVPLAGALAEIQQILNQVQNPDGRMTSDEAMAAIGRLIRRHEARSPAYQKPLG